MGLVSKSLKGIAKGTGKIIKKTGFKELTGEALENATLYERVLGHKANALGVAGITAIGMGAQTVNAIAGKREYGRIAKLGNVSAGENLDRLISYDGSGFVRNFNKVSGGDPEVMRDIVSNAFDSPNQFGATGDLVFALHNMREG